jgi:hypothetical protein
MTWLYPPPAAPPLIPKTGPSEGWRMLTDAFRPIRLSPWARPTVVVDLPSRRRRDRGDDHVPAARPFGFEPFDGLERDLGLRRPVELELVVADPEVGRDVDDRARRDGAGDLEVGREGHRSPPEGTGSGAEVGRM